MVSRIARNSITVPSGVEVKLDQTMLTVKGKLGELSYKIPHHLVKASYQENGLKFDLKNDTKESNASVGTTHALAKNMIVGVTEGFSKTLTLVGVGYRAEAKGDVLKLLLGFSHPVEVKMPKGIGVKTPAATEIVLNGIDKQQVALMAAKVRAIRPPEPYKGKGVRYKDEQIKQKEVKKK